MEQEAELKKNIKKNKEKSCNKFCVLSVRRGPDIGVYTVGSFFFKYALLVKFRRLKIKCNFLTRNLHKKRYIDIFRKILRISLKRYMKIDFPKGCDD